MLGHSTAGVGDPSLHWGVGVQDMGVQHGGMRVGGGGAQAGTRCPSRQRHRHRAPGLEEPVLISSHSGPPASSPHAEARPGPAQGRQRHRLPGLGPAPVLPSHPSRLWALDPPGRAPDGVCPSRKRGRTGNSQVTGPGRRRGDRRPREASSGLPRLRPRPGQAPLGGL